MITLIWTFASLDVSLCTNHCLNLWSTSTQPLSWHVSFLIMMLENILQMHLLSIRKKIIIKHQRFIMNKQSWRLKGTEIHLWLLVSNSRLMMGNIVSFSSITICLYLNILISSQCVGHLHKEYCSHTTHKWYTAKSLSIIFYNACVCIETVSYVISHRHRKSLTCKHSS